MSRSLPHFLNDQCNKVLRNFPYVVKKEIINFPPISSTDKESVVAVLSSKKQFLEGLWSLWSWMKYVHEEASAVLLIDGKISNSEREIFNKLFPGGSVLELDEVINTPYSPKILAGFVEVNWTGKKYAAVYELQKTKNVIYSDCDVVLFSKPTEIIDAIKNNIPTYLYDYVGYSLDPWLSERAESLGIKITNHFNAGLVAVPKGTMSSLKLDQILKGWDASCNSHHAEQTLFSMMVQNEMTTPLAKDKYVLSWQGVWLFEKDLKCSEMVCRHYTGPTRHRMYLSAYPFLKKLNIKN